MVMLVDTSQPFWLVGFTDLGKKSRWRRQRNGLPQGSVLAPMLFNIYTNDQPVHADTRSFIYADDLCIASQGNDFKNIEVSLTSALSTMTTYYDTNQLRANPSKTQVCAFHPRNREAKRELNVMWNGTRLSNTTTPVYLGIHLDRTLCYKTHIEKTKMKVNARNNIIRKLANSKWGCKASTLRPSCLALCYSAAEYACPVWARSAHAPKLNPALHDCCRIISGCLKPTNLDSVHLLAGIAPPHIRRTVACRMERTRQTTDDRHQLFHHQPAASRLKSRKGFMLTVTPLDSSASSSRLQLWKDSLTDVPSSVKTGLEVAESLPAGSGEDWLCWRAINRLRTGVGRAKTTMRRWGYLDDAQSVDCDCGEPQTMAPLLSCRLLDEACTADDLATVTERAKACARKWENIVWRTRKKRLISNTRMTSPYSLHLVRAPGRSQPYGDANHLAEDEPHGYYPQPHRPSAIEDMQQGSAVCRFLHISWIPDHEWWLFLALPRRLLPCVAYQIHFFANIASAWEPRSTCIAPWLSPFWSMALNHGQPPSTITAA